jgi:hypothetical protein
VRVFHFLKPEFAIAALEKGRLKVARIDEFNDPFELICPDLRDPRNRRGLREFKTRCAKQFGYLCFTKTWQNLMLWSMYAGSHRGAALEIELADDAAMPVKYRRTRIRWDVQRIMATGGFKQEHVDVISTTKSKHWAYEQEIRAAVNFAGDEPENGHYFATVDIRGIVVGEFSTISEADIRAALPIGKRVTVTHTRLAFGSYNIVRRKDLPVKVVTGEKQPPNRENA